ncbi:unnamed protein product [Trifolium pratense]|uniref:Uncharacterized protein n=1 Tax=Trifolium pratense TaxID=57577 RepID=A0ACB0JL66_TRIPR|nr:unnamed protein product [Trifolium pratense]
MHKFQKVRWEVGFCISIKSYHTPPTPYNIPFFFFTLFLLSSLLPTTNFPLHDGSHILLHHHHHPIRPSTTITSSPTLHTRLKMKISFDNPTEMVTGKSPMVVCSGSPAKVVRIGEEAVQYRDLATKSTNPVFVFLEHVQAGRKRPLRSTV